MNPTQRLARDSRPSSSPRPAGQLAVGDVGAGYSGQVGVGNLGAYAPYGGLGVGVAPFTVRLTNSGLLASQRAQLLRLIAILRQLAPGDSRFSYWRAVASKALADYQLAAGDDGIRIAINGQPVINGVMRDWTSTPWGVTESVVGPTYLAAAGQVAAVDNVTGAPCFAGESQADCNARAGRVSAYQAQYGLDPWGTPWPTPDAGAPASQPAPQSGPSAADIAAQNAAIGGIASAIGTTGLAIANAFRSGDQIRIAQINADSARQIAILNAQAAATAQAGNAALAAQQAQQAQQLQLQLATLQSTYPVPQNNTTVLVIAGIAVAGIAAYLLLGKPS